MSINRPTDDRVIKINVTEIGLRIPAHVRAAECKNLKFIALRLMRLKCSPAEGIKQEQIGLMNYQFLHYAYTLRDRFIFLFLFLDHTRTYTCTGQLKKATDQFAGRIEQRDN